MALTAAEYTHAQQIVRGYNDAIRELAAANSVLDRLPGRPLLPTAAAPFGRSFSLGGIHPSSFAHQCFAQALAVFLNEQFATALNTR